MNEEDRKEYDKKQKRLAERTMELNGNHNTWVWEWFPEPMPMENKYGTSFNHLLNSMHIEGKVAGFQDDPSSVPAPAESVLVFADSYGFTKNILKYAPQERLGRQKTVQQAPGSFTPEKVEELLADKWDLIIFGYSIDIPATSEVAAMHKAQDDVFQLLLMICKNIQAEDSCKRLAVLTCDMFATDPEIHEDEGARLITYGHMFGWVNTFRMESLCKTMLIDTEWSLPETAFPSLSSECFRHETFGCNTVRILKHGRYVARHVSSKPYEGKVDFKMPTKGVVIVTGGNGSTAQVLNKWIVESAAAQTTDLQGLTILCASRSATVNDQNMKWYKDAKSVADRYGAKILHVKSDCSRQEDVLKIVEENTPNVVGVIHTAGLLVDTLLSKITWDDFEKCWDPKSRAALYFHDALEKFENPGLKFFIMFSSVSVYGSPGQLNYSSGNAFQDALARHRVARGKPALAMQWTNWGEVGMFTTLAKKFQDRILSGPMLTITNKEGAEACDRMLSSGLPWCFMTPWNWNVLYGMFSQDAAAAEHAYGRSLASAIMPFSLLKQEKVEAAYSVYLSHMDYQAKHQRYNLNDGILYKQFVKGTPLGHEDSEDED